MRKTILLPALLALGLAGCADMNSTQQRTLTGGAAGAAGGALIGAMAGNAGLGALIGGAAGAGGGYLFDQSKQSQQRAYEQGYQQGRASHR
ncbi:YMGG-like glycine zipper-containing protein [Dankookia sp. P2]|uniref:YMGG-like glycine zipper-containing protein n=1 Tax=Dankookia sp. P2 TaxID=3423955 RepID=UPI003D66C077